MRRGWFIAACAALVIAAALWLSGGKRGADTDRASPAGARDSAAQALAPSAAVAESQPEKTATPEPPPITVAPAAAALGAALLRRDDPVGALQAVEQLLYFYRQGLGENPVGQNEDIVAAMLGENPKRAAYLLPDSPAVQGGKLLDPWGTPYWFHPVSRDRMEIRSAGPDRELFTNDDLQNE